jgi:uncharacterized protein (DUF58 family)
LDSKKLLHQIQQRPVTFVPGKKVVSILPGEWTSPYEGKGYEPLGYRDFQLGDDPRRINLPATARRGEPTIVERVALRDFKVMVVIDISPSMKVREKWEMLIQAVALLLYSAWQSETTFGLGIKTESGLRSFGLGLGSRHFYHLYHVLWHLYTGSESRKYKGTKVPFSRCLPPNAMLLYCSDYLDGNGNIVNLGELWRAVQRYDFIPVVLQDDMEYTFPDLHASTFLPCYNPETGNKEEIWLTTEMAQDIRSSHEMRFQELVTLLKKRRANPLHLDIADVEQISRRIDSYFRKRKGRCAA